MVTEVRARAARAYVAAMLVVVARGLVALARVDPQAQEELAPLPEGFVFEMKVLPSGPSFRVRKRGGALVLAEPSGGAPDLSIQVKHLRHAVRLFTFEESLAQANANNRIIVDGDVSGAMRMQRVIARLMTLLLPSFVAAKVTERVPAEGALAKGRARSRLFWRMAARAAA